MNIPPHVQGRGKTNNLPSTRVLTHTRPTFAFWGCCENLWGRKIFQPQGEEQEKKCIRLEARPHGPGEGGGGWWGWVAPQALSLQTNAFNIDPCGWNILRPQSFSQHPQKAKVGLVFVRGLVHGRLLVLPSPCTWGGIYIYIYIICI